MIVEETKLKDVLLIKHNIFEDHRGEYVELYNEKLFHQNGIKTKFIQDDVSISSRNVLRGLHGDDKTWKLISCLYGKFYFVVADADPNSKTFGKWQSFVLSDRNKYQILVPPNHANGHLALSHKIVFHYKQSTYYDPKGQFTYRFDDPKFNIWWPVNNPILSMRDDLGRYV
jgi:dTDP-4-dehydrorhamnose 3,5-epimerase